MSTDGNPVQAVEFGVVANPGVVADLNLPGERDPRRRAEQHFSADLRAEKAEKSPPPGIERLRRETEQGRLHKLPQQHDEAVAASKTGRNSKFFQILKFTHHGEQGTTSYRHCVFKKSPADSVRTRRMFVDTGNIDPVQIFGRERTSHRVSIN